MRKVRLKGEAAEKKVQNMMMEAEGLSAKVIAKAKHHVRAVKEAESAKLHAALRKTANKVKRARQKVREAKKRARAALKRIDLKGRKQLRAAMRALAKAKAKVKQASQAALKSKTQAEERSHLRTAIAKAEAAQAAAHKLAAAAKQTTDVNQLRKLNKKLLKAQALEIQSALSRVKAAKVVRKHVAPLKSKR